MNTTANVVSNRVQIYFYAILIAFMSGINRLRTNLDPYVDVPLQNSRAAMDLSKAIDGVPERPLAIYWTYLSQLFIRISIWIIFGFAVGYLIGMLNPW